MNLYKKCAIIKLLEFKVSHVQTGCVMKRECGENPRQSPLLYGRRKRRRH